MAAESFQARLGYTFRSPELLEVALTHRSYAEEVGGCEHNERLEYLGDAVVELAVTELLFEFFPLASEGALSRIRSMLVKRESLAQVGQSWEIGAELRLGRGETDTGRTNSRLLANAVEAVLGAIYRDAGVMEPCRVLIRGAFCERLDAVEDPSQEGVNPKSRLQELTVKLWRLTPKYVQSGAEGPAHQRRFSVTVRIGDHISATGEGRSKKLAQFDAARRALNAIESEQEEE